MRRFGLIGYPLSHSFSKKYFTEKFSSGNIKDCVYELYPLESISSLSGLLQRLPDLYGLNVTIPYKQQVIPFLDELDETAREAGAVNTIRISRENKKLRLAGYNTDVRGFEKSFLPLLTPRHKSALILGTGGASKAVEFVFKKLNIPFTLVSRSKRENTLSYTELNEGHIKENTIIVNTTPLGMYPDTGSAPAIPYHYLSKEHLAYDLVYNPEITAFMQAASAYGAGVKNGLEMLLIQAEEAWKIWNSRS